MRTIALVTSEEARLLDEDLPPLADALQQAGVEVHVVSWDSAQAWSQFDMLLLRSTWDYMARLEEFLRWAQRAARAAPLLNSLATVQWNIDKHYLGALQASGVPIISTTFLEPGCEVRTVLEEFLALHECHEFVVKPSIGAGSRDAQRFGRGAASAAITHAMRLLTAGRSAILQPYLSRVDEEGETALIFFGGEFSHAIRKGPLLRAGAAPSSALFAPEVVSAREASPEERALARQALAALPFTTPLYARVDLLRDDGGSPRLLELELIEPSLFFAHAPQAAARFARCIRDFAAAATVSL